MNIKYFTVAVLAGVMALTRSQHFGSSLSLPDATLAIFFLAGLSFSRPWLFAGLLLEAGLIDYLAINQFNVSDYCVSPAYLFLIPTYAVMWFAGRFAKPYLSLSFFDSVKTFALAASAVTVAFAISNSSFFWFSGRFADMSWLEYVGKTGHYFLPYFSSTLIYAMIGLVCVKLWQFAHKTAATETNQ